MSSFQSLPVLVIFQVLSFILISLKPFHHAKWQVCVLSFILQIFKQRIKKTTGRAGNDFRPGLWSSKSWMWDPHTHLERIGPSRGSAQTHKKAASVRRGVECRCELETVHLTAEIAQLWFACCGNDGYIRDKAHKISQIINTWSGIPSAEEGMLVAWSLSSICPLI